jgi:hypothetical protein
LNRKARRHPVDNHRQTGSMRFARGQIAQHAGYRSVINYSRLGVPRLHHRNRSIVGFLHLFAPKLFCAR